MANTGANQHISEKLNMTIEENSLKQSSMEHPDVINLTSSNMVKYGFARFCFAGEVVKDGEYLSREIELPRKDSGELKLTKVKFPESSIITLPKEKSKKITAWDNFSVTSAGQVDAHMYLLSQRAGWNQTNNDIKVLTSNNPEGNLLGQLDIEGIKNPLGSGLVLKVGDNLSWIGMILVHPELRRQGIANAIMERCIEIARLSMNTPIVGLDATPDGLQVYKRMGFKESFNIWRCKLKTHSTSELKGNNKIKQSVTINTLNNFLINVKLSSKIPELELIQKMYPEGFFVSKKKGEVTGFVMNRPGRLKPFIGPLVAASLEDAKALLFYSMNYWKAKGWDEGFIDIPELNFEEQSRWNSEDFNLTMPLDCKLYINIQPVRSFVRMYEAPDKNDISLISENYLKNRHSRSIKTLEHAEASLQTTNSFMSLEKNEMLKYMFAIGGPELS